MLRARGLVVESPVIVARTGWTTDELSRGIDAAAPSGPFDLVTLQIGVNDQYRGRAADAYADAFAALLRRTVRFAGGEPRRVIVISIPDWSVTPFAAGRDRARIAAEIDAFNAINRNAAGRTGALYVDVTPTSRPAATDATLLVRDGLHPSAKMYDTWAQLVLEPALRVVDRPGR